MTEVMSLASARLLEVAVLVADIKALAGDDHDLCESAMRKAALAAAVFDLRRRCFQLTCGIEDEVTFLRDDFESDPDSGITREQVDASAREADGEIEKIRRGLGDLDAAAALLDAIGD